MAVIAALAACMPARDARPTSTPLPIPSPTPIVVARTRPPTEPPAATRTPAPKPTATVTATLTPTPVPRVRTTGASGASSSASTPDAIRSALVATGIDSNVYWFKSGDEDQLMVQYASPIRFRPGYEQRLQTVKEIAASFFLKVEPPLYTLWIAATDITGTSDTVLRLDRATVEQWARGEIGDADFYNNGFTPATIVLTCDGEGCIGEKATPFPTFPPFPFPFLTPTP